MTLSAGGVWRDGPGSIWPHLVMQQADQALYQAKHAGRNRWVMAGEAAAAAPDAPASLTAPSLVV